MYEALAAAEKVAKSTVTRPFSEQRPDREAERDSRGPAHDLTHAMQQFWRPTLLQLTLRFEGDRTVAWRGSGRGPARADPLPRPGSGAAGETGA